MSSNSTALYIHYLTEQFTFYSAVVNLTLGLIGNVFVILIFHFVKVFRKIPCGFYLSAESLFNIGLLLSIYSAYILTKIIGYRVEDVSLPWCRIRAVLTQVCGICSGYMISCMSFDQYLTTHYRPTVRQKSTLELAHRLVFVIACFWTLHNMLFLVFSEVGHPLGCNVYNPLVKKYLIYFYFIASNAFPQIIMLVFSFMVYRNIRRIVRRQIPIVRRRLDRQLTAMVLARVICLFVLSIPFVGAKIYQLNLNINPDDDLGLAMYALIAYVSNSLVYLNFSINFYLFLIVSSRFRRQVKNFLLKQVGQTLKSFCCGNRVHVNSNRIVPLSVHPVVSIVQSVS